MKIKIIMEKIYCTEEILITSENINCFCNDQDTVIFGIIRETAVKGKSYTLQAY